MRPCIHADSIPQPDVCRICELYVTNSAYRRLWDGETEVRTFLKCKHIGAPAGAKGWHICEHPDTQNPAIPAGDVVCSTGCNGKCTQRCAGYAADGVIVDHGAGGIGDGLLGLLPVAKLNETTPVEYRVSHTAKQFVALFNGYSALSVHKQAHSEAPVPGAMQLNAGYTVENRSKYPVPRWERYARNVGVQGFTIPSLREPQRIREFGIDLENCVALCPYSTDKTRQWSAHHWLTLEAMLHRVGYETAVFHSDARYVEIFKGKKVAGESEERVAGVMLNACCTIGTDSGLAHLSGILGKPTIVLGGSTPVEKIFGAYQRVRCVQGNLSCSGCCGGTGVAVGGMSEECNVSCANLQCISPDRIMQEVDKIWLKETLTCDDAGNFKSLITADRLASLRSAALATNNLQGDIAEFGCYLGGSAKLLRYYTQGTLHLFDTFAGIPTDDTAEGGHHIAGEFCGTLADVQQLVGMDDVVYHVGTFPTGNEPNARFRLVHLDADTYQSTRDALAYFAPRMVQGGMIVLDDFGWWACPGVGRACHEAGYRPERSAEYQAVIRF